MRHPHLYDFARWEAAVYSFGFAALLSVCVYNYFWDEGKPIFLWVGAGTLLILFLLLWREVFRALSLTEAGAERFRVRIPKEQILPKYHYDSLVKEWIIVLEDGRIPPEKRNDKKDPHVLQVKYTRQNLDRLNAYLGTSIAAPVKGDKTIARRTGFSRRR